MAPGRSKQAFKQWLAARPQAWRDRVEVVAMDGFTGFKTAAAEELPQAVAVMDPFHVVRLAGDALDQCRRRVQQDLHGHRGRQDDPLYRSRRTLHTGADLLTDKQRARLTALFAADEHVEVEATWGIYQRMIAAYREPDRKHGRDLMTTLIESVSHAVPAALTELRRLGRTLTTRAGDVLAYFDRPGTSNGPTEAIIIWSPQRRVIDVAHGADRVRQRHVIWSMSTTSPTWLASGSRRVDIRSCAGAGLPRGGGADEGTAGAHADDGGGVVDRRR